MVKMFTPTISIYRSGANICLDANDVINSEKTCIVKPRYHIEFAKFHHWFLIAENENWPGGVFTVDRV